MGLVNAKIILRNPREQGLKPLEINALVDSGAVHLCIPQHIAIQLKLDEIDKKKSHWPTGQKNLFPMWDPLKSGLKTELVLLALWLWGKITAAIPRSYSLKGGKSRLKEILEPQGGSEGKRRKK